MKNDTNSIVRVSNILNLTRQEFTIIEKQIYLITLLNLKERQGFNVDSDNDLPITIEFSATELKETNRERIREALDKITSRKIYFDNSAKDREHFGFVVPFSYANYSSINGSNSKICIDINNRAKKTFLELANGYTTMDLKAILNLKSVYSIRMYELMSMYLNQGSWTIKINDLRNLFNLKDTEYKNYGMFEKRIIIYAQKELWLHCGIDFTWRIAQKERKKITALTFTIKTREKAEKIFLNEQIKETIDFVKQLSPKDIAQKYQLVANAYTLTPEQIEYIISNRDAFNDFIRVDMIIDDMITKGKPPRDKTAYLASSLGLNKIKFRKSKAIKT